VICSCEPLQEYFATYEATCSDRAPGRLRRPAGRGCAAALRSAAARPHRRRHGR
jgi:hypothetical protein